MRKLTILEFTIIGFFLAIVLATYLMYITSMDIAMGAILTNISLIPVLKLIPIPANLAWISSFFFYILVYTLYSLIIAVILKYIEKSKIVISIALIVLLSIVVLDQVSSQKKAKQERMLQNSQVASVISAPKIVKQYFGNETRGDLNGDGRDDIAFVITRNDKERGVLYYLTSAISSTTGNFGTNLVFLGNDVTPKAISIADNTVNIEYMGKKSTTTAFMYARIVDNELKLIEKKNSDSVSTTTQE